MILSFLKVYELELSLSMLVSSSARHSAIDLMFLKDASRVRGDKSTDKSADKSKDKSTDKSTA